MKCFISILLLSAMGLLQPEILPAQNLVPNGNFEKHTTFDFSGGPGQYINYLHDWKSSGTSSWAIYCHKDFVAKFGEQRLRIQEPWVNFDTLNMRSGDGMLKLFYMENCSTGDTGCASYVKTKLTSPLELGEVYEVSMWVFTKTNLEADPMAYTHMGMFLTRRELIWKNSNRISTDYYFSNKIVTDQWTEIKWYIRALCSMQYLTIGAFKDDSFPSLWRQIDNPVFYYVDDVTIKTVNEDSLSTYIHPTPYCEFYEKEEKQRTLQSITNLDLHFESNSSTLDPRHETELDSFYQVNLLRNGKIFVILGHTDSQAAENVTLSEARAESVKSYLGQKYHYPEISKVGRRQARALSYIILHQGDSLLYEKYIPIVKARCMEGEAEWDVFAMMTDKLHVVKKELQEYGTQYSILENGKVELYKVDDIKVVNERRKRIGMGPTAAAEK